MAIYRIHKNCNYTVMSNTHFKEKEMSLKAKGLLSLMLSLPDDWDYSVSGLVALSKDGKDSVMNALTELEKFRYLRRTKLTDEKGRFSGYDYDVYESPIKEEKENPYSVNPYAENPNTDKPHSENPQQLNTNSSSTKESNTKKQNIYCSVVDYLNQKAGTAYKPTSKATQQHINARLAEGFTLDDFKRVIDNKCDDWLGTEWEQYLRPATLFGTKFESYLNSKKTKGKNGVTLNFEKSDLEGVF